MMPPYATARMSLRASLPRVLHFAILFVWCASAGVMAACHLARVPGPPLTPPGAPPTQAGVTVISIKKDLVWLVTEVEEDLWACDPAECYRVDTSTSPATLIPLNLRVGVPAVGFGSIWYSKGPTWGRKPVPDQGLYRLDLKTNEQVAKIPVPASGWGATLFPPSGLGAIFIADGSVWVRDEDWDHLYRVDPSTNQVTAKVALTKSEKSELALSPVAAALGSVWVLYTDGTLNRIDPETNQFLAEIRVGAPHRTSMFSTDSYSGLTISEGTAWITESKTEGNLIRVDLKTNQVVATMPVGYQPSNPVVGGGFVWLSTYYTNREGHFVVKVDPRTNQVLDKMFLPGTAQPSLSAQSSGILAWGEELKLWDPIWSGPNLTYIYRIPYHYRAP